jgi:DNA-binding HxlR family transcriptional regulator
VAHPDVRTTLCPTVDYPEIRMVEDADSPSDTHTSALPPEVVDLLCLVATAPTRPVVATLREEAPATVGTLARQTGLSSATVEECLTTLTDHELVSVAGTPPRYRFTDAGRALWPVLDALESLRDSCEG